MKKILLSILFILTSFSLMAAEPIRVACVGNSITYGAGIVNREKNSYPAQLQYYLGDGYNVKNFGVNARTLLSSGDLPYTNSDEYKASLAFNPNIVLIKLGTNDTKPRNNKLLAQNYKKEYAALIDTYKNLPSKPEVVLLTPVVNFATDGFDVELYQSVIIPALRELALEKDCGIINLYSLFEPKWEGQEHIMPDKLHPSSLGAGMMAQKIGRYLTYSADKPSVIAYLPYKINKTFNFHGYRGVNFNAVGADCMIVEPRRAAKGNPWVWRARFWGHEPQTDIALLENGFHVVYCDVADLYGAPGAVERWNRFYKLVAMHVGLNKKVALEGMSRGGLIIYNWAAANPSKVACIYADAPVMDFKSWPMGKGTSDGSVSDTKQLLAAYGFADEATALKWKKNPLDHAKQLARAGVPMLHVVGDVDVVVPISENTTHFEATVKDNGGNIKVIHKPNVGHHPHSLQSPTEIVNFILKNYGYSENACTRPIPGNEYRSGAGWVEGNDWHSVAQEITDVLAAKELDILLIGNSITQGFAGSRQIVTHRPGKEVADKVFAGKTWEAAGISGDRTQSVLWRIQNGNYNAAKPKKVVITIGINNVNAGDSPKEIAQGIKAVAKQARETFPQAEITMLGLLPAGKEKDSWMRVQCDAIHSILAKAKWDAGVRYVNPTKWFVDENGTLKEGLYSGDNLHLGNVGYDVWCTKLAEIL